ncbi:hypothetical protein C4D60_Mb02t02310 [Musa balbisiana]|uniref:Bidirectional sugar transporter SWEET n=1 Tax=Musa balbisiana TaxID=52838 RepID=A0A4S8I7R0_MUSBA|nr:hypothetical protein C4D60_Mb02t02310 [Musa balbisiana]
MGGTSLERFLPIAFGILGNIISFVVYLAPVPTILKIYQNKSAEGYSSLSYNLSLFSCLIWVYYAHLKPNSGLLISINAIGCLILTCYITIYLVFATRKDRIFTIQVFVALNLVTFIGILFLTLLLFSGTNRLTVLGWICVGFSISVYAAPMSTIRRVVRTRSVEFMPVNVLVCLTLSAAVWFGYGVFTKDAFISIPCLLGVFFGIGQIVVYVIYKRKGNAVEPAEPEHIVEVAEPAPAQAAEAQVAAEGSDHEDGEGGAQEPAAAAEHITKIAEHVAQIAEHIVKLAEITPMSPTQEERKAAAEEGEGSAVETVVPENVINIPASEMNGRDE